MSEQVKSNAAQALSATWESLMIEDSKKTFANLFANVTRQQHSLTGDSVVSSVAQGSAESISAASNPTPYMTFQQFMLKLNPSMIERLILSGSRTYEVCEALLI